MNASLPSLFLVMSITTVEAAPISGQRTWETTLLGRDLDGNAATFEAYYDKVLDVTWLANANPASYKNYPDALVWVDALSYTVGGSTWDAWRLPKSRRIDGRNELVAPEYTLSYDGSTDVGYNTSAPGTIYAGSGQSELANLFYSTLGNTSLCDTSGNCPQAGYGLSNSGPFSDIQSQFDIDRDRFQAYWSSWEPRPGSYGPFVFAFGAGIQDFAGGYTGVPWSSSSFIWAVHDGDVGDVPVPAAIWFFGSGLLGLAAVAKRRKE